jgi:hypothetical protein
VAGQALSGAARTAAPRALEDPVGQQIKPPNAQFFTLSSEVGSNIVDSVAIPPGGALRVAAVRSARN